MLLGVWPPMETVVSKLVDVLQLVDGKATY